MGHGNVPPATEDVPRSLAHLGDTLLIRDAKKLAAQLKLSESDVGKMIDAAFVARDADVYERVAWASDDGMDADLGGRLPVKLSHHDKKKLREEKGKLFSETAILLVTVAVSVAAFLQGHVQASINAVSLYKGFLGVELQSDDDDELQNNWKLGVINSMPFFASALFGCWLALPLNDRFGRRGALAISAVLILVSSLVLGLAYKFQRVENRWLIFLALRTINGIGMGIKAVSAPILASETAIRFWRGSFLLAWQLWVAFGIMIGNLMNLGFSRVKGSSDIAPSLMLAAPVIPSVILLIALSRSPESPRYYMRGGSGKYLPRKALSMLLKLRTGDETGHNPEGKLLAYKDMYLLHKTIEQEYVEMGYTYPCSQRISSPRKLGELFTSRRLRNATISSSTVSLAQQLCGINISAIYSGSFFISFIPYDGADNDDQKRLIALGLGLCFGGVNWLFGLPAIKTIDTLGRRKWLIATLPLMALFMGAAAYSFPLPYKGLNGGDSSQSSQAVQTLRLVATFIFLHAAVYSPGLGPIPFTLASESFPSSHREVGCAFVISVNLLFAGLLTLFFPSINAKLTPPGTLCLFCGLTFVAWVLVYFLVEETRELSLESLSSVFRIHKRDFVNLKYRHLGWLLRRYVLRTTVEPEPEMKPRDAKDAEKMSSVSRHNRATSTTRSRPSSILTEDSEMS